MALCCEVARRSPGAQEPIVAFSRQGCPIDFVTNALESPNERVDWLTSAGIAVTADEIITAPQVLKTYLVKHTPDTIICVISDPLLLDGWRLPLVPCNRAFIQFLNARNTGYPNRWAVR